MISKNQQIKAFALLFLAFLVPQLAHSAEQCPEGSHWVRPHFRKGYVRHDGKKFAAAQIRGHCRRNPRGYEKWHQRLSNKRPEIWGYVKEQTKKWSTAEVERVYDALSVLPQDLLDIEKIKIFRMDESRFQGNPATTNMTDIVLYDRAFRHEKPLAQILAHEILHTVYRRLDKSDKKKFAKLAGWQKVEASKGRISYLPPRKEKPLLPDSYDSIMEDYANHLELYLFEQKLLKRKAPKVYEWIKRDRGADFKLRRVDED